jgi:hypothetical protein
MSHFSSPSTCGEPPGEGVVGTGGSAGTAAAVHPRYRLRIDVGPAVWVETTELAGCWPLEGREGPKPCGPVALADRPRAAVVRRRPSPGRTASRASRTSPPEGRPPPEGGHHRRTATTGGTVPSRGGALVVASLTPVGIQRGDPVTPPAGAEGAACSRACEPAEKVYDTSRRVGRHRHRSPCQHLLGYRAPADRVECHE